jgi:long-subunit fatty acid transport protein
VYREEVTYEEIDTEGNIVYQDSTYDFISFRYDQNLETVGSGINFKLGAIYKPADWIRLGAAIHSPTYFYEMHDDYSTSLRAVLEGFDETFDSPQGVFDYKVTTPFRAMGSVAFIIMQYGLLSMDYEFVDYSMAKLNSTTYKFSVENDVIRNKYTQAANLRFGTEWKYGPLALRGGYAIYGSPFAKDVATADTDLATDIISFGLGFRQDGYFADLGYSRATRGEFFRPYTLQNQIVQGATYEPAAANIQLTLGVKF